jgi:hypothetical protein
VVTKTFHTESMGIIKCTDAVCVETVFADYVLVTGIDQGNSGYQCHEQYAIYMITVPIRLHLNMRVKSMILILNRSFQLRNHVYSTCRVFKITKF